MQLNPVKKDLKNFSSAETIDMTALQHLLFSGNKNIFYKLFVYVRKIVSSLQRK